jgi:hypothetical protein
MCKCKPRIAERTVNRKETEQTEEGGGTKIPPPHGATERSGLGGKGGTGAAHLQTGEQWRAATVLLSSSLCYLLPAARLPPIIGAREREESALLRARPGAEDASFAVAGPPSHPPSPAAAVWPLSTARAVRAACVRRTNTTQEGARERRKGRRRWERGNLGGASWWC